MSPILFKNHNEGEDPMDLVATHQRLLVGATLRTTGPILELGVGWYSTPLLHEIAEATGRKVYTIDNNPYWLDQFKSLATDHHLLWSVGWWGELMTDLEEQVEPANVWFGLCFVDQGQPAEREYAVRALMGNVDVFVMHDTEEGFAYGYDRLLGNQRYTEAEVLERNPKSKYPTSGLFKYQWTDRCQKAWTTVASTKIDVTKWFTPLPPVEPTSEVT